jgi:hypothetical protein
MLTTKGHIPSVLQDKTRKNYKIINNLQYTVTLNYSILHACHILAPVSLQQENYANFVTNITVLLEETYCGHGILDFLM